jgi:hypothetical protein
MAASPRLAVFRAPRPSLELRLEQTQKPTREKPKFDAAFIERRLAQHREMMRQLEDEWTYEIVREVLTASEAANGRIH